MSKLKKLLKLVECIGLGGVNISYEPDGEPDKGCTLKILDLHRDELMAVDTFDGANDKDVISQAYTHVYKMKLILDELTSKGCKVDLNEDGFLLITKNGNILYAYCLIRTVLCDLEWLIDDNGVVKDAREA